MDLNDFLLTIHLVFKTVKNYILKLNISLIHKFWFTLVLPFIDIFSWYSFIYNEHESRSEIFSKGFKTIIIRDENP